MKKSSQRIVISLGGSLIVPDQIDVGYLNKFYNLIMGEIRHGAKFLLICGGGRTARNYQKAARQVVGVTRDDLDWLGVHSTRLNAHLLRTVFRKSAHPEIITHPADHLRITEPIVVAAGWRPGWSTDYVAVRLADNYESKKIINLSNIDYVYDSDPKKNINAKKYTAMNWKEFRKLVGNRWDPGANVPFDPVAAKWAEKIEAEVSVLNGKDLANVRKCIRGEKFRGTIIK